MKMDRRTFIRFIPGSFIFLSSEMRQKENSRNLAPDFKLPDLNGKTVMLSDFKNNVVVLDFWASWCEPCIAEIPNLNALHEKHADRGLRVLGIVLESGSVKDIRQFVTKHKIDYQILIGNDNVVNKYNVAGFPTTLLIDPQRQVQKKYLGVRSGKESNIERDVQALLSAWKAQA